MLANLRLGPLAVLTLLLVRVVPKADYTSLTAQSETVEAIRSAVADAAKPFAEFDVGLTGRPALSAHCPALPR